MKCLRPYVKPILMLAIIAVVLLITPAVVSAGTGGPTLPWNTPLQNLLDNLTGQTARILAAIMLVIGGIVWGFSGSEEGAKRFGQGVCAIAIMFGAVSIVTTLSFSGATM